MEIVILIGLQASGKSTFYRERFADTHVRINLDMLRTRNRERRLVHTCLEIGQPLVIDNTNPTRKDRERYIPSAKSAGFRVIGYYLQSKIEDCRERNELRDESARVPLGGLLATYGRMELPDLNEGFGELHYVRIDQDGRFVIEEWSDEV